MAEWASDNVQLLVIAGLVLFVGVPLLQWFMRRARTGARQSVKVYCKHCNWEGVVQNKARACKKCKSTDLHVLSS